MNNKKELATKFQESRVAPTQMEGEAVNTPFERDLYESTWGAEKAYFLLHHLNKIANAYNKGVFEDDRIRKPIPHFHTFFSLSTWIANTNPKTVKCFFQDVFTNLTNGIIYQPDSTPEEMNEYLKELSKYLANGVDYCRLAEIW